jgi:hypothetical protein
MSCQKPPSVRALGAFEVNISTRNQWWIGRLCLLRHKLHCQYLNMDMVQVLHDRLQFSKNICSFFSCFVLVLQSDGIIKLVFQRMLKQHHPLKITSYSPFQSLIFYNWNSHNQIFEALSSWNCYFKRKDSAMLKVNQSSMTFTTFTFLNLSEINLPEHIPTLRVYRAPSTWLYLLLIS